MASFVRPADAAAAVVGVPSAVIVAGWPGAVFPVTGMWTAEAEHFVQWVSSLTDAKYRLPVPDELHEVLGAESAPRSVWVDQQPNPWVNPSASQPEQLTSGGLVELVAADMTVPILSLSVRVLGRRLVRDYVLALVERVGPGDTGAGLDDAAVRALEEGVLGILGHLRDLDHVLDAVEEAAYEQPDQVSDAVDIHLARAADLIAVIKDLLADTPVPHATAEAVRSSSQPRDTRVTDPDPGDARHTALAFDRALECVVDEFARVVRPGGGGVIRVASVPVAPVGAEFSRVTRFQTVLDAFLTRRRVDDLFLATALGLTWRAPIDATVLAVLRRTGAGKTPSVEFATALLRDAREPDFYTGMSPRTLVRAARSGLEFTMPCDGECLGAADHLVREIDEIVTTGAPVGGPVASAIRLRALVLAVHGRDVHRNPAIGDGFRAAAVVVSQLQLRRRQPELLESLILARA